VGIGSAGNIGADTLTGFDSSASAFPAITRVWNPLDVNDGRSPELREQIIRRVPQAYRAIQLRAITLEDYVKRAEELSAVSHAHARYAWTGSWRTVRVAIDLKAGISWNEEKQGIKSHLDAVRLIGEDLEIREASFASLDILLRLCAHPDYWPEDLAFELAAEFSEGYNARGQPGFFHADLWTFGQSVHASQVIGRALAVTGVERVLMLSMRRWHSVSGPSTDVVIMAPEDLAENEVQSIEVEPWQIIRVASDPNHLERGRIQFDIQGGRR
jgi:predicted phage baseplate assembly protein